MALCLLNWWLFIFSFVLPCFVCEAGGWLCIVFHLCKDCVCETAAGSQHTLPFSKDSLGSPPPLLLLSPATVQTMASHLRWRSENTWEVRKILLEEAVGDREMEQALAKGKRGSSIGCSDLCYLHLCADSFNITTYPNSPEKPGWLLDLSG